MKLVSILSGLALGLMSSLAFSVEYEDGMQYQFLRCSNMYGESTLSANILPEGDSVRIVNLQRQEMEPLLNLDMGRGFVGTAGLYIQVNGYLGHSASDRVWAHTLLIEDLTPSHRPQRGLTVRVGYSYEGPVDGDVRYDSITYRNCDVNNKALLYYLLP